MTPLTITDALVAETYLASTVTVPTIANFGATFVDVAGDQPPFLGIIFEMTHPDAPGPWRQFYRCPIELVTQIAMLLLRHAEATDPRR